jgi:RNA polymerase sigma-70 factor (ECF subfamily)
LTDSEFLDLLKTDGEKAIEFLFKEHYDYLCRTVYRVLPKPAIIEDLVQDVFFELWRKHETLNITTSIKAYLRRAAVNKTLNYIRSQRLKLADPENTPEPESRFTEAEEQLEVNELQDRINKVVDSLPERCRMVFVLSRFEEKSYKEIAEELGISIKTVENQISKALKLLRKALDSFMIIVFFVGYIPFFKIIVESIGGMN